jgi:hypothetical protein
MYIKVPDESKIKLNFIERSVTDKDYLDVRERLWEKKLKDAKEKGRQLFNGKVYTVEKLVSGKDDEIIISMSVCEYKDIILNLAYLNGETDMQPFYQHSYVLCLIKTIDDYYIFTETGSTMLVGAGRIDLIGGTLNQDEAVLTEFGDIRKFILKEIEEESGLQLEGQLDLIAIGHFNLKFGFTFQLKIDMTKDELLSKVNLSEINALIALRKSEITEFSGVQDPSFEQFKNYLDFI